MHERVLDMLAKDGEQIRSKLEKVSEQLVRLLEEASGNSVWKASVDRQLEELRETQQQVKRNQQNIKDLQEAEDGRRRRVIIFWGAAVPLMLGSCGKLFWDFIVWYSKQ